MTDQMVPVALFFIERAENPGFEAKCDVFAGFGATAGEALDARATAIEEGPPVPAPAPVALGEAPAVPAASAIDYDVLAGKVVELLKPTLAAEETTETTTPPPPAAS